MFSRSCAAQGIVRNHGSLLRHYPPRLLSATPCGSMCPNVDSGVIVSRGVLSGSEKRMYHSNFPFQNTFHRLSPLQPLHGEAKSQSLSNFQSTLRFYSGVVGNSEKSASSPDASHVLGFTMERGSQQQTSNGLQDGRASMMNAGQGSGGGAFDQSPQATLTSNSNNFESVLSNKFNTGSIPGGASTGAPSGGVSSSGPTSGTPNGASNGGDSKNIMNKPAFHNAVYSRLRNQLYLRHRGPSVPTMQSGSLLQSGPRLSTMNLLELPQEVLKFNAIPRHTTYVMQSYAEPRLVPILAQRVQARKTTTHISSESAVIRAGTGNVVVTAVKAVSYMMTGSAAMFAECVHSLVDAINQFLLYKGVRQARQMPDKKHQYGYGRAMYVWSMISANVMLWTGGFATIYHGIHQIATPDTELLFGWITPAVLFISGAIDSYVFIPVLKDTMKAKPKGMSWYKHFLNMKDPTIAAVLFEDMAACLGVALAFGGLAASYVTGNPLYDGLASISIGVLLGTTSLGMMAMNKRFLLGQAVDAEIEQGIKDLLLQRKSISRVSAVQSQWLSANRFTFKAELDFEGEYFANYLGQLCYNQMFKEVTKEKELTVLLNAYTEDVIRMMEEEIDSIEDEIRTKYPEAAYIELEPSSIYPTSLKALHFTKTIS